MYIRVLFILLMCIGCGYANRYVVELVAVNNGAKWGDWQISQFCPRGQYAIGYNQKIESKQGRHDDTSLNGIKLLCGTTHTRSIYGATVTSGVGPWGNWFQSFELCRVGTFLSSFRLQVESPIGRGDDTAANFVSFRCRPLNVNSELQISQGRGSGFYGTYGSWSRKCPIGSAICGLKTRVESHVGKYDDTALNDVMFYCCT